MSAGDLLQLLNEYLLIAYAIPVILLVWATADVKSFITFLKFSCILLLLGGVYASGSVASDARRNKGLVFFTTLLPFFYISVSTLISITCLLGVKDEGMKDEINKISEKNKELSKKITLVEYELPNINQKLLWVLKQVRSTPDKEE